MKKQSLKSKLLDILFPPRCIFCNEIVPMGSCICKKCDDKIFLLDDIQTAKVENESFHGICIAPYLYEDKIQELIVNFKFYHKPQYGTFFGNKLAEAVCDKGMEPMCEVVVSVPISKERLKERGYNQSELIAKKTAECLGVPYVNCMIKTKHNSEQHRLHLKDRKENVKGVYELKENKHITNKKVLLVDDIVTTGYTLAECAAVLMKHGAKEVLCGAIACRPNVYSDTQDPFEEACIHTSV